MSEVEEKVELTNYEAEYLPPEDPGEPLPPERRDRRLVTLREAVLIVALIVLALVSAFPVRAHFSTPETYAHTIEQLDNKRNVVMGLTAAATGASVAITTVGPDDAGTPVADRLMDLAGDLGIVLIAIYLEKYLLTIFGVTTFGFLIPIACAFLIGAVIARRRTAFWATLGSVAVKLVLMGIVLVATIPVSVTVTDMIEHTYDLSISTEDVELEEGTAGTEEAESTGNPFMDAWNFLASVPERLGDAATGISEELTNSVSDLIDGFAVLIITTCAVPLGVLAFFLWAANLVTGVDVSGAMRTIKPRTFNNVRNDVRKLRSRTAKAKR